MNRREALKSLAAISAGVVGGGVADVKDLPAEASFYTLAFPDGVYLSERDLARFRREWEELFRGPEKSPILVLLPNGLKLDGPFRVVPE